MSVHVAVDIGASSGRVIVAEYEDNHFEVSEVHRFKNGFGHVDGHDRWNIDDLSKRAWHCGMHPWNRYLGSRLCSSKGWRKIRTSDCI